MPIPILFETLAGAIDGVNVDFQTTRSYKSSSVRVWVNGRLEVVDFDDGWIELGGNIIRLKVPPLVGMVVRASYTPI